MHGHRESAHQYCNLTTISIMIVKSLHLHQMPLLGLLRKRHFHHPCRANQRSCLVACILARGCPPV